MFKVNEYFDGKVKSLAFQTADGPATIGVIAPGEYEFGTATKEIMTVVSGKMDVHLPDAADWKPYGAGESFIVESGEKFKVRASGETAYLCLYK